MRRDPISQLALGLGTGVLFGACLHRARVAKHDVIIDQLKLDDFRVAKVMGAAVVVSAIGIHWLQKKGRTKLEVKPLQFGGVAIGGVLFGAGLGLLGYCPGTTVAALGAGHRDAWAGVAGMFLGATAFVATYPKLKPVIEAGKVGKIRLLDVVRILPSRARIARMIGAWLSRLSQKFAPGALGGTDVGQLAIQPVRRQGSDISAGSWR